jgi:hypothetical protein
MRQRRDKTRPDAEDDDHRGIPRDAAGDPVFLILPAKIQTKLDVRLAACRLAWEQAREPLALTEATTLLHYHRQPVPKWLEEAFVTFVMGARRKQQAERYQDATTRMARYTSVRDRKVGIPGVYEPTAGHTSWEKTLEDVAEEQGRSAENVKAAHKKVRGDLKAGRHGVYFTLKDRRYRRNGKPDPTKVPSPPFGSPKKPG